MREPLAPVAVTVLAKAPRPGDVKTRLARSIGEREAATVAQCLALDVLERLAGWLARRGARADRGALVLSLTGDVAAGRRLAGAAGEVAAVRLERQVDGDLGARIEASLRRRMTEGYRASLVLGADAPLLPDDLLDSAVTGLEGSDAVLAPARDGGFVLIGAGTLPQGTLQGVEWGTERALAGVLARLAAAGYRSRRLAEAEDVDDLEDLLRLAARLEEDPGLAPRTAGWLAASGGALDAASAPEGSRR